MSEPSSSPVSVWKEILHPVVIVGALGYFVDIYDLLLFNIVRYPSLKDLGVPKEVLMQTGIYIFNWQMAGMLVGGLISGVIGDRKGRLTLLFGSIIIYSLANIANGFVTSVGAYALLRFIAGIGLAGELGGSITLVSEVLSKENRGYGTALVASIGVLGAVAAGFVADWVSWRNAYFIGGGLGLALLILRLSVSESSLFQHLKEKRADVTRGNFFALFTNRRRFGKYLRCILIGLPSWYVVGVLVALSPDFAKQMGIQTEITAGKAVMMVYLGLTFGDLFSGFLSQWIKSRKKVVSWFILFTAVCIAAYFLLGGLSATVFYSIIFLLGIGIGYWAVFITIGAEQFGTNIRATVATTVPNFVRGSTVPITSGYAFLAMHTDKISAALVVGAICLTIPLIALAGLAETYGKDLDYLEDF